MAIHVDCLPGWVIVFSDQMPPCAEEFNWDDREIWISTLGDDLQWRVVHAIMHLRGGKNKLLPGERFPEQEEIDCDDLADLYLGRIDWRKFAVPGVETGD